MIDKESTAAKNFYKEIRRFSERTQSWESQISYETKPDEAHDLTLVSQRVYGRRDEYLVIMAAAGLDMVDQALPQKRLTLPTEAQLFPLNGEPVLNREQITGLISPQLGRDPKLWPMCG